MTVYKKWFAPDGLMCLKPFQYRDPYGNAQLSTCLNDNGILYLTLFNMLKGGFNRTEYLKVISRTKHSSIPGIYHRADSRDGRPGGFEFHAAQNSHDNYDAMACGCIVLGETQIFKEVVKHWPIINNVTPGKINWESINTRTPSGIMGPASWFLFYLAAGKQPGWISTIAYCINLMVTAFAYKHFTHHSEHIRAWMTIKAVSLVLGNLNEGKAWVVRKTIEVFNKKIKKKSKFIGVYFLDFVETHPLRDMGIHEGQESTPTIDITGADLHPFD